MKALLLYPEFPEPFWSFKHILRFIATRATLPALSLFTVAAMLPEEWQSRMTDVNVSRLQKNDPASEDTVLISALIAHTHSKPPSSHLGTEAGARANNAFSRNAIGAFFDQRFGKDFVSMIVVPAAQGSGCLVYDRQGNGWRGSVLGDDEGAIRSRSCIP